MFLGLEGLERGDFWGGVFPNPGGTGGTIFAVGGGKLRFFSVDFYYWKKPIVVHNDLENLDFHLNPVEDSTVNLISIVILGRNVKWYVNNTIALVIVKHVLQSTQMCSTCQKCKI